MISKQWPGHGDSESFGRLFMNVWTPKEFSNGPPSGRVSLAVSVTAGAQGDANMTEANLLIKAIHTSVTNAVLPNSKKVLVE